MKQQSISTVNSFYICSRGLCLPTPLLLGLKYPDWNDSLRRTSIQLVRRTAHPVRDSLQNDSKFSFRSSVASVATKWPVGNAISLWASPALLSHTCFDHHILSDTKSELHCLLPFIHAPHSNLGLFLGPPSCERFRSNICSSESSTDFC